MKEKTKKFVSKYWLTGILLIIVILIIIAFARFIKYTNDVRPLDTGVYAEMVASGNPAKMNIYVEDKNQVTLRVDRYMSLGYGFISDINDDISVFVDLTDVELEKINIGDIVTIRGKMTITSKNIFINQRIFGGASVENIEHVKSEITENEEVTDDLSNVVYFDREIYNTLHEDDAHFADMLNYIASINRIKGTVVSIDKNYWTINLGSLCHGRSNILVHMNKSDNEEVENASRGDDVEVKVSNVDWTGHTSTGEGYFLMADNGEFVRTYDFLESLGLGQGE